MSLDDATTVIVGVMPPDFIFPDRDTDYLAAVPLQRAKRRRGPQQPVPRRDRQAQAHRHVRAGPVGDAGHRRPAPTAVSQGARRQERERVSLAGRGAGPVAHAVVGAGRRLALRAADRVHQPRQPVDVARARAPHRVCRSRGGRRQRRPVGPADADRQPGARSRRWRCSGSSSPSSQRRSSRGWSPRLCRSRKCRRSISGCCSAPACSRWPRAWCLACCRRCERAARQTDRP